MDVTDVKRNDTGATAKLPAGFVPKYGQVGGQWVLRGNWSFDEVALVFAGGDGRSLNLKVLWNADGVQVPV